MPTYNEWKELENYLILNGYNYDGSTSGNKIAKSLVSSDGWLKSSNVGSPGNTDYLLTTKNSGFAAQPAGGRNGDGTFEFMNYKAEWWSNTILFNDNNSVWGYNIYYNDANTLVGGYFKNLGLSVRCICDYPVYGAIFKESDLIKVYPNPTTGIITIEGLPKNEKAEIALYNMNSKLVKVQTSYSSLTQIDISEVVSGIYLLVINNRFEQAVKIIKR